MGGWFGQKRALKSDILYGRPLTGTKNTLKHTEKHKSFGNDGYFMRESKGTLSILKLA